jgi:UDP-N-acetylglucosamine 2-epimerase (non-hydrolysing)
MDRERRDRPLAMLVVGARPNFVKIAPILAAVEAEGQIATLLVHTGQHYDAALSAAFFHDLEIRARPIDLDWAPAATPARPRR